MGSERAMAAVMNIEGFRALGSDVFETVINKSELVKGTTIPARATGSRRTRRRRHPRTCTRTRSLRRSVTQ